MKKPTKTEDDFITLDEDVLIHSTKAGKLYIKASELFARKRTIELLKKLMESSISKGLEQTSGR
jgi:hypothetical protein